MDSITPSAQLAVAGLGPFFVLKETVRQRKYRWIHMDPTERNIAWRKGFPSDPRVKILADIVIDRKSWLIVINSD